MCTGMMLLGSSVRCWALFFIHQYCLLYYLFWRHSPRDVPWGNLVIHFIKNWKTSAVSTTDWMVETQLCKLRGNIRHVRWTCLFYISFIIWFLWAKPTIWLLILSFTKNRPRLFHVLSLWRIQVGDSPACCQGQQDDFQIIILCTDTI